VKIKKPEDNWVLLEGELRCCDTSGYAFLMLLWDKGNRKVFQYARSMVLKGSSAQATCDSLLATGSSFMPDSSNGVIDATKLYRSAITENQKLRCMWRTNKC
jgi:hypothetical protein